MELDHEKITRLSIKSDYEGPFPPLDKCINLKEFSSYRDMPWEYIETIPGANLIDLTLVVNTIDFQRKLLFGVLEKFTIFVYDDTRSNLTPLEQITFQRKEFDFSGMPKLKYMNIGHWDTLDYVSLNKLTNLETLIIKDTFLIDLEWAEELSSVKTLKCYCSLENIEGISNFPNLKDIDLRGNKIRSIKPLMALQNVKTLNVRNNPLKNGALLRTKGIINLVIDESDYALNKVKEKVLDLYRFPTIWVEQERDINVDEVPFYRKTFLIKPESERLERYIQAEFSKEFFNTNPLHYSVGIGYEKGLKEKFIELAVEEYPFLIATEEMEKQIKRENKGIDNDKQRLPGEVIYIDNDLYLIKTTVSSGSGDIKITSNYRLDRDTEKGYLKFINQYYMNFISQLDFEQYDYTIRIENYYRLPFGKNLVFGILLSMKSAVEERPMKKSTALCGCLNRNGEIYPEYIGKLKANAAAINEIRTIITYGKDPKKMIPRDEYVNYQYYDSFEVLFENCLFKPNDYRKQGLNDPLEMAILELLEQHYHLLLDQRFIYPILKDYFMDYNKELTASRFLIEMGILKEIERVEMIDSKFAMRYEKALWNEYGIDSQLSHEITRKWCYCYGKLVLDKDYQPWD